MGMLSPSSSLEPAVDPMPPSPPSAPRMPPARVPPLLNIGNWGTVLRTARIHERPMSISGAAVRLAATRTAARIG